MRTIAGNDAPQPVRARGEKVALGVMIAVLAAILVGAFGVLVFLYQWAAN